MQDITFNQVLDADKKASLTKKILDDLPEWFGIEESTQEYIEEARNMLVFQVNVDKEAIGFISFKETSRDTVEIHCVGIKKKYHNQGLGSKLYNYCMPLLKQKYEYIQVKTVDEGYYKEYDATIKFYESLGFKKLEVFPKMWDLHNPCLILIKKL